MGPLCGREEVGVGVIGEAAGRAREIEFHNNEAARVMAQVAPAVSRRASGDAGHVHGCARDHALDTACVDGDAWTPAARAAALAEIDAEIDALPIETEQAFAGALRLLTHSRQASALAIVQRLGALDDGQAATVLRVCDAIAAGVSLEAREALGREMFALVGDALIPMAREVVAERLFAIGRASVVPPDADLARVIAAWPWLEGHERAVMVRNAEASAREGWREVAANLFRVDGALRWVRLEFAPPPGVSVIGCDVDGEPATVEQWARLHAAGVPVADGAGPCPDCNDECLPWHTQGARCRGVRP
jgi:hypothetical protein